MTISRRNFIKYGFLTGMSVALAACQRPVEHKLVSQYQMPEYKLPGQPVYWATSCGECASGCGLAAKTNDGRLTKIEGLVEHPANRGKLCARGHSALQDVYHPNRLNAITPAGKDWPEILPELAKQAASGKNPLWIVSGLHGTRGGLMLDLAQKAGAKIWVLEFPGSVQERRVIKAVTGKAELPLYKLEEADYVVTFGGDFLNNGHTPVYNGWGYGQFRRGLKRQRGTMVSVSSRMNMTTANSDRWLPVRPGSEGWVALAVGNLLAKKGKGPWPAWAASVSLDKAAEAAGLEPELIERLADRLATAKKPLVIADPEAGNYVNGVDSLYIVHALGKMLGGLDATYEPDLVLNGPAQVAKGTIISTKEALAFLGSGNCGAAWVFDVDPATLLPKAFKFDEAFKKAGTSVAFATFPSATTALCKMVLPVQMWLEEWGDRRILGGGWDIYNIQQPVVSCAWENARSINDILMFLKTGDVISAGIYSDKAAADNKGKFFRDLIRGSADDQRWETMLARGGAYKDASREWEVYPNRIYSPPQAPADPGGAPAGANPYESLEAVNITAWGEKSYKGSVLVPFATLSMGDGTLGNRSWLQELPDPITTIVWGPWLEINSELAKELGIERHDLIEVTADGLTITAPAVPLPSVHRDTIGIPIGDVTADFKKWEADRNGGMDFGAGNEVYGRYGFTNKGFGKQGLNPRQILKSDLTAAGEPIWVSSAVSIKKLDKKQMVTAMDQRVFNLPREILPLE